MILIGLDSDDCIDIDEYVFYMLGLGYTDDLENLSSLYTMPGILFMPVGHYSS